MASRLVLLLATFFVAAVVLPAAAQEADSGMALRGAITDADAPGIPAAPPEPAAMPAAPAVDETITQSIPDEGGVNPAAPRGNTKATRVTREPAVDTSDPATGLVTGASIRRVTEEDDPFAPLGIRIGSFIYYPAVTVGTGFTSNAQAVAGGKASPTVNISPELLIQSDWARHAASLDLSGSWEHFTNGEAPDNPTAHVAATGRIDFADRWNLDLGAGYDYSQQSVSDPNFPAGATDQPGVHQFNGSVVLNGALGRNEFAFETRAVRTVYEDASADGVRIPQSYRDNDFYSARLRYGFEVTPVVTPFVEGELFERLYDDPVDNDGIARTSRGFAVRAGVAFDDDPILKGEIGVGFRQEKLDDAGLATLRALTVDGSLAWSPTELTTITTKAATGFNPSTDPRSPGSIFYNGSIDLAYAWRRNVTFDLTGSLEYEKFVDAGRADWTYDLGASATWKINRNLQLVGGYVHEWLDTNIPDGDYSSDTVRVDLRLQH